MVMPEITYVKRELCVPEKSVQVNLGIRLLRAKETFLKAGESKERNRDGQVEIKEE